MVSREMQDFLLFNIEELTNVYWYEINTNEATTNNLMLTQEYNGLSNWLQEIAKDNNIKCDLSAQKEFVSNLRDIVNVVSHKEVSSTKQADEVLFQLSDVSKEITDYIYSFLGDSDKLVDTLELNSELLSEYDRLLKTYKERDERHALDEPFEILDNVTNQRRMETQEEADKRAVEELQKRKLALDSASKLDPKEQIANWIGFLDVLPELSKLHLTVKNLRAKLENYKTNESLSNFKKDDEFIKELNKLMEHDKTKYEYLFHGTQCLEDARNIAKKGLLMAKPELSSTTYSEMTPEQVLQYQRGFVGEVGADAIVVIKRPIGENIVQDAPEEDATKFLQSGLGGFTEAKYVVPSEYIVGVINKQDHKIEYPEDIKTMQTQSQTQVNKEDDDMFVLFEE